MKRVLLVLCFLFLLPCVAKAQTATATWNQAEPPSISSLYVYTLKNTSVTQPSVIPATCITSGTGSACSAPVPSNLAITGTFTLTVTCGTATGCTGSAVSAPFVVGGPAQPGSLKITFP